MPEAFIIDAVRTPVTRRGGSLARAHPADLGAHVIRPCWPVPRPTRTPLTMSYSAA